MAVTLTKGGRVNLTKGTGLKSAMLGLGWDTNRYEGKADFDLENHHLRINKNYQVINGEHMITSPKSEKGNRVIDLPEFLCREMEDYFESLYKADERSRIFDITKSYLHHELDRGCKKSGVKRIRLL